MGEFSSLRACTASPLDYYYFIYFTQQKFAEQSNVDPDLSVLTYLPLEFNLILLSQMNPVLARFLSEFSSFLLQKNLEKVYTVKTCEINKMWFKYSL